MAVTLPYLASPGSIKTCLDKIKAAATPDLVTQDFITTKLQIKGGTGKALIPYLKKIGFVASDGSPTEIYKRFRNHATAGAAAADAVKTGYKELQSVNEYFYDLNDKDLLASIVQVTGVEADSQVAKLTLSTLKTLKSFANFEAKGSENLKETKEEKKTDKSDNAKSGASEGRRSLKLSYTINLNLPATSDQAVFNAIFRSLAEHLINNE
jgi:hypothetical protein